MADYRAIAQALPNQEDKPSKWKGIVDYLTRSGEELAKGARTLREVTDPFQYAKPAAELAASMLPGAGFVQGSQDARAAGEAFRQGNYGQAAVSGLSSIGNTALEALGPVGHAAMAVAPMARKGIIAYHGSPHDFDKFDLSKIGTGEGAQSYGRGLYFADNFDVANSYRKTLSGPRPDYTGEMLPELKALLKQNDYFGFDTPGQAASAMRTHPDWPDRWDIPPEMVAPLRDAMARHDANAYGGQGRMYEVNIAADPSQFLDWDAPASSLTGAPQQFLDERLRQYLGPAFDRQAAAFAERPAGEVLQETLGRGPFAARLPELGVEAGVPGIKYLDQGSRGAGDGSRNYVVFDDKLITILRKYGWVPGAAIPAAALAELQNDTSDGL